MATIKEIRTLCGMTQNDFSKKVGVNIRLLQKYESGECSTQNMSPPRPLDRKAAAAYQNSPCGVTDRKSVV